VSRFDDDALVVPDGGRVRGLRRRRGWSRRALVAAVAAASERASGVPTTLSLNQLAWIEEANERVPYAMLCLLAAGLECEPVELVEPPESSG
jgi:transcriptional regulator with XRE-family HTH domain